jgi:hypothetical protein
MAAFFMELLIKILCVNFVISHAKPCNSASAVLQTALICYWHLQCEKIKAN